MAEPIRNPVFMPLLPAGQTWTMTSQNRLTGTLIRRVRAEIYCTTAGTLYVEESDDQAFGASTTLATITVAASTTPTTDWVKLSKKWWRLRYVNGGAAQTSLAELWLEKDYRDVQDVEITGSSVAHDAPSTANPILTGFVAESTTPAAVADGDLSQVAGTLYGAPFVNPVTSAGAQVTGATGAAVPAGASLIGIKGASGNLVAPLDGPTGHGTAGAGVTGVIPLVHDNVGLVYNRLSGVRGAADGAVGSDYLPAAGMGFNGTAWDQLRSVNTGQLVVTLKSSIGRDPYVELPADNKVLASVYGLVTSSVPMLYDGTANSPQRGNTEGTLLISAARTVAVNSTVQTNYNGRGVVLALQVTANPGGAETLQLQLILSTPVGGGGNYLAAITTVAAVNQTYHLMVYPSATSAPENPTYNKAYSLEVTRDWYARVQPSGAGSWTYSLEQVTNV